MKNKALLPLGAAALALCLLAGCKASAQEPSPTPEATITPVVETPVVEMAEPFSFADLADLEFWFGSGAGAWCTVLNVRDDGTFEGEYHDSDMGLMYLCNFTGKLTEPVKVNDYTYSVKLEELKLEREPGGEEDRDGIHIIYAEPYGLEDAEELLFYLPGAPVEELPEEYVRSARGYGDSFDTELPFYGLYNVNGQQGYSSHRRTTLYDQLEFLEQEEKYQKGRIGTEVTAQAEMTEIALEIYRMWDKTLNDIWDQLKEKLNETAMESLTAEELEWIAYKEAEAAKAGADVAGGTLQPMVEYGRAAELTKARVYELASYFLPGEAETTAEERYRDILLGRAQFLYGPEDECFGQMGIDAARTIFNPDSKYAKISSFAVVDMNGDGEDEVVLQVTDVANDMGGYLFLHQESGTVYGFQSGYRTFWQLKTDGTFQYSAPAGQEEGIASVQFSGTGYTFEKLMYGTGEHYEFNSFTVDGQSVSQEKYHAAAERQEQKPGAKWYDFTPGNIKAVIP